MNRKWTYSLAVLTLVLAVLFSAGCTKLKARDQLNKGVQAYKNARYSAAVENFKEAVRLDPQFQTARLYLGMAYYQQYIPGAESPENKEMLQAAQDQFMKVLESDNKNTVALASMANAAYNQTQGVSDTDIRMKKLDEARDWYLKLVSVDPKNKEAYYTMGVIAWAKWYPLLMQARTKAGMRQEEPGPLKDKKVRDELRAKYLDMINDGIGNLKHALDLDPRYDEAMAYLNLLYRERADLADTPDEYKGDIAQADQWLQKTLDTRKAKANAPAMASGEAAK
jgi:tetratricopeptide (TPR) repeat protein